MRLKLLLNDAEKTRLKKPLEAAGFVLSETDCDYTLYSNKQRLDHLVGTKDETLYLLAVNDISVIESFANEVYAKRHGIAYRIKYKLYELEHVLEPNQFMRINQSTIINLRKIQAIKPQLNRKYLLNMTCKTNVDVTRSYYYTFKAFIEGGQ